MPSFLPVLLQIHNEFFNPAWYVPWFPEEGKATPQEHMGTAPPAPVAELGLILVAMGLRKGGSSAYPSWEISKMPSQPSVLLWGKNEENTRI